MWLIFSKNCGVNYLLCVTNVFTKYAWVKPLKDNKAKTVIHCFIEIKNELKRKPNNLRFNQKKCFTIALCKND